MAQIILQTNIPDTLPKRGKVRDIYDLGDSLIIAASDRISAFDVIMKTGIPYKGAVLTQISKFWFDFLSPEIEHHLITDDVAKFPAPFNNFADQLKGRSMLVKKTKVTAHRMCRARVSGRFRLEGIPAKPNCLRPQAARRPKTVPETARR